jgi:DNA-binding CsgD family transcriptional regulator
MKDINRLKVVLVEKKRTSKWLSEQLKINPSTVQNGVPILRSRI